MADDFELDDDERELIAKRREARSRDSFEVRIRDAAGNEGTLPYGKARSWFQRTFGIDLDDEPAQDDEPAPAKGKGKSADETVKRFTAGRRIS
jgi:hypothetical protein